MCVRALSCEQTYVLMKQHVISINLASLLHQYWIQHESIGSYWTHYVKLMIIPITYLRGGATVHHARAMAQLQYYRGLRSTGWLIRQLGPNNCRTPISSVHYEISLEIWQLIIGANADRCKSQPESTFERPQTSTPSILIARSGDNPRA